MSTGLYRMFKIIYLLILLILVVWINLKDHLTSLIEHYLLTDSMCKCIVFFSV